MRYLFHALLLTALLAGAAPDAFAQTRAQTPTQPPPARQPTQKQNDGTTDLLGKGKDPMQVTADQGIEWQQNAHAYIARGNATAKRGNITLKADTLTAYYRNQPGGKSTEIWRVTAEGHVRITTPSQSLTGDKGIYDLDQAVAVLTGKDLRLTSPQEVVTARDSMEWYENRQLAVARGDALVVHGDRRLHADVLAAQMSKDAAPTTQNGGARNSNGQSHISRVDAVGHVLVSGPDQIGTGDEGVYDVDKQLATLSGHVTLTRGNNTLSGEYGVVDFKNNISRLLPKPGGVATATANGGAPPSDNKPQGRVEGYLVPKQQTGSQAPATVPATGPGAANGTPQAATP
ncbi:MAG TPA: LptA/OstA family protein [Stellaceae bacterium]|nr:LptA/OstA family protein [Stellaceae bacterium]